MKIIAMILFFLMLAFPYLFQIEKVLLISLWGILIFIKYLKSKKMLSFFSHTTFLWVSIFLFMNLFYLTYGFLRENPGVYFYVPIYVIWIILFFILYSQINAAIFFSLLRIFDVAYFFIAITGLIVFLQENGMLPVIVDPDFFGYKIADRPLFEFKAIQGGAVISFMVLFSYRFSKLILNIKTTWFQYLSLLLGLLYIFATSRRAFIIEVFFLPIIVFFYFKKSILYSCRKKEILSKLIVLSFFPFCLIVITSVYLDLFDSEVFATFILSGFDKDEGIGYDERSEQFVALIDGWHNNFLFGAGTGVNASIARSKIPGAYELSYIALLFERGIIGFCVYVGQLYCLVKWNIHLTRKRLPNNLILILISYNVSLTFFLIANASNPYLGAFDHLWIIFFSLLLVSLFNKKVLCNETEHLCHSEGL